MSPKHLVAAVSLVLMGAPASAQSVKAGIEAWQRADYTNAVAIWRPFAEKGDTDAEFNLGQAYRLGRGVPLDLRMAKRWFEKAANAGHLDAQTTLGLLLFQNGDQTNGLNWLRKAADRGEPRALLVYGTALYNGDGVTQDRLLGYAYVSRAAALGLAPAKDTLNQLDGLMSDSDKRKAALLAEAAAKPSPGRPEPDKTPRVAQSKVAATKNVDQKVATPRRPKAKPVAARPSEVAAKAALAHHGNWRIQLGAFSQRASAEALYRRIGGKAALAGRNAVFVPAGSVTRLQVGPFESRAAAAAACTEIGAACFPVAVK